MRKPRAPQFVRQYLVLLCLVLAAPHGWAAACDAVFTNGVQSHDPGGEVDLGARNNIDGGGAVIDTTSLSAPGSTSCDGGNCTASGSASAASSVTIQTGSGGDGGLEVDNNGSTAYPSGDYAELQVGNDATLDLSGSADYLISDANSVVGDRGDLILSAGNYWLDGDLVLNNDSALSQSGTGTTRLFVNGSVDIRDRVATQGFAEGELLIYATGNIVVGDSSFSAYLYAQGRIDLSRGNVITGAVAANTIATGNNVSINFSPSALDGADLAPFCGGGVSLEPVAYWQMDEFDWAGTTSEVVDSSGSGNDGTARGGANTGSDNPAIAGDPGTCRYGEFDGVDDYLEVGSLSDTLNSTASLAFWINTTETGNDTGWQAPGIAGVEEVGGADDIFWGWLDASGRIGISVGNEFSTKSSVPVNNGSWRHVVLTRDHQAGTYKIYIDGELDSNGSIATGVIGNGYNSVGRIEDGEYFAGLLDEVRVYDGILSDDDVATIAAATHPCADQLCPSQTAAGGLLGEYYDELDFGGGVVGTRADGPIDFDWADGSPGVAGIGADQFSVEWNGYLRATETGEYVFQTASDDGVRLWIDSNGDGVEEQVITGEWNDHAVREEESDPVSLVAGKVYPIRMQYYENGGQAVIRLRWSTPSSGDFVPIPAGTTPTPSDGLYHCVSDSPASYEITHSPNGVTCEAEPVTVRALDANGDPIAPADGTEITLGTTPGDNPDTSWAGGNTYVFSGSEDSTIKYLHQTSPATLDLSVFDGTASGSSGPIEFADTGLRFYADRSGAPLPDQVAAQDDPDPVLRAVRTDDETGSCLARVADETRPVGLGFECRNPGSCIAGQTLTLNDQAVQANNLGETSSYTSMDLAFDSEGYAAIPLNYTDVGTVRLLGELVLPEEDEQPAITLTTASNEFVVKPETLAVISAQDSSGTANPGTTASGAGFVASGEAFSLTVQARNANGDPTPNFGNESPTQNVRVELAGLEYPGGGALGNLGAPENFTAEPNGQALNNSLTWDNVGTITLTPRLRGDDYQGAGDLVELTESDPIGRFYPFEYALGGASVTDACGGFSYMDQPDIDLDYTVNARNAFGGTTTNYDNTNQTTAYAGVATPNYVAEDSDSGNGSTLSGRVEVADVTWDDGVLIGVDPAAAFRRALNTRPDGPWSDLQWGLQLTDALDGRDLTGLDMNAATSGDCASAGNCTAVALGEPLNLRFGRLRLNDAYGPEVVNLPVPFFTEYWNGTEFVRNVEDSCTLIPREAINYPGGTLEDDGNRTVAVGGGSTTGEYDGNLGTAGVSFLASDADHSFTAPGRGNTGSFEVQIDLINRRWLRFDWNQNGDYSDDIQMPPATIGFGSYRGHDRIIYWREVLE